MSRKVKCLGETASDCAECGMYYSSTSNYFHKYYKQNVSDITCSIIGDTKIFNEDGEQINRT